MLTLYASLSVAILACKGLKAGESLFYVWGQFSTERKQMKFYVISASLWVHQC